MLVCSVFPPQFCVNLGGGNKRLQSDSCSVGATQRWGAGHRDGGLPYRGGLGPIDEGWPHRCGVHGDMMRPIDVGWSIGT